MSVRLSIAALILSVAFAVSLNIEDANTAEAYSSYYGYELLGSPTASGEPFEPWGYTAAHKTLPLGTVLKVSYGDAWVLVTVNDRGPYIAGRNLDLSLGAADFIGLDDVGHDVVDMEVLYIPE